MIFDEFYSHYVWNGDGSHVSAAGFVQDVDKDPVILLDGLTKNWRYPGWRVSWILAPEGRDRVRLVGGLVLGRRRLAAAPARGGGTVTLRTPKRKPPRCSPHSAPSANSCEQRSGTWASCSTAPGDGTFYCWGSVAELPPPLDTGMGFFRAALEKKVIVVPGEFFDINPGKRRAGRSSRFRSHVRFSFGPTETTVRASLERLAGASGIYEPENVRAVRRPIGPGSRHGRRAPKKSRRARRHRAIEVLARRRPRDPADDDAGCAPRADASTPSAPSTPLTSPTGSPIRASHPNLELDGAIGHSMGVVAALVAAEALTVEDSGAFIAARARAFSTAAKHFPNLWASPPSRRTTSTTSSSPHPNSPTFRRALEHRRPRHARRHHGRSRGLRREGPSEDWPVKVKILKVEGPYHTAAFEAPKHRCAPRSTISP